MSMSVDEIRNVILLFSNPAWKAAGTVSNTVIRNITALSSHLTYSGRITENITVLASKYAGTANGVIQGLLYIPDLSADDPCVNQTAPFVPASAARQADLPPSNYNLIAIAPWINAACTKSYLASAHTDPIRGLIFFRPSDDASDGPPPADSALWDLNDGGRWRTHSGYPIYAVSGQTGEQMMYHLSLYSGSVPAVPFGENLTALYNLDPYDYVRVWTELSVSTTSSLSSIWIYILIIAGVLLSVISLASFSMHFVQARRRACLRRRVISGEVNLEAMGIKRLTVPIEHIQSFPLFTYLYDPSDGSPPTSPISTLSPRAPRPAKLGRSSWGRSDSLVTTTLTARVVPISEKGLETPFAASTVATDYQPTCTICLEHFQNRVTIIRELPCGHIFHVACIDEFLSENSSLCPLCKASMLPKGYCPNITNPMARREYALRRLRDVSAYDELEDGNNAHSRIFTWGVRAKRRILGTGTVHTLSTLAQLESRPIDKQHLRLSHVTQDEDSQLSSGELARKRMRELAGSVSDDGEPELKKWRKMRNRVFPGF
ncbi:hypothetical protein B0T22DRAFT_75990 [Podospora appendiculata]|uniref:RING-type domain-containing protein n=1 Tax=Podospora appendiculata TaxID=314037 RepID=A0AAE0XJS6_9PEZI|nr:hypothetical protein B0T22DRAFT_75990 [Podospora appendiculata]